MLEFLSSTVRSGHIEPIPPHTYDPASAALSILIAILCSYVAADLAAQVTVKRGRSRYLWLGWGVRRGAGVV
jgi:NO-binding membrane sensor protein with MHYT domain